MSNSEPVSDKEKAKYEWRSFLFITIFLFPILAVAIVGGYGFIVWAMQVFFLGPPGHG
ncbi:trimethylamine N-oxide reductase system protein TorE [Photobacterium lutimaris]|uniref:Trimethylamine N-oxide reductase system protein TorE n=1 Tax=Photobacterium lutimaris TaxID=388278 RepID=A0A2T3J207_9GAMM|nr:trimethylamine N-oxide reductase system protein TorE [Photobacterium lutimaris]PSU35097.1 trimethylamine N-oxide reductase system protein TorE [Photobacterium lutimaris]TDR77458.1 nitrate reductase NapE [Photobacterium lutimaris]